MVAAHFVQCQRPHEVQLCYDYGVGIAHCPLSNAYFADGNFPLKDFLSGKFHDNNVNFEGAQSISHDTSLSTHPSVSTAQPYRKIGLGTDVAGGYAHSMFEAMRHCVIVAKMEANLAKRQQRALDREQQEKKTNERHSSKTVDRDVDIFDAFELATLGGARVCGLEDHIGSFSVGKEYDAVLLTGETLSLDLLHRIQYAATSSLTSTHTSAYAPESVAVSPVSFDQSAFVERMLYLCSGPHISRVWVQGRLVSKIDAS